MLMTRREALKTTGLALAGLSLAPAALVPDAAPPGPGTLLVDCYKSAGVVTVSLKGCSGLFDLRDPEQARAFAKALEEMTRRRVRVVFR